MLGKPILHFDDEGREKLQVTSYKLQHITYNI